MGEPTISPGPVSGGESPQARHLDDDQCLDLVSGLLSGTDREVALDHAATCVECAERLLRWAGYHECARADGRVPNVNGERAKLRSRRRFPGWWWVPLAAMLVIWLGRSHPPVPSPSARDVPAAPWIDHPVSWRKVRGGSSTPTALPDTIPIVLRRALAGYRDHRPEAVVRLLAPARYTGALEDLRVLYLANSLLHLNRPAAAESLLEGIALERLPPPWRGDARRTLAAARRRRQ